MHTVSRRLVGERRSWEEKFAEVNKKSSGRETDNKHINAFFETGVLSKKQIREGHCGIRDGK